MEGWLHEAEISRRDLCSIIVPKQTLLSQAILLVKERLLSGKSMLRL